MKRVWMILTGVMMAALSACVTGAAPEDADAQSAENELLIAETEAESGGGCRYIGDGCDYPFHLLCFNCGATTECVPSGAYCVDWED